MRARSQAALAPKATKSSERRERGITESSFARSPLVPVNPSAARSLLLNVSDRQGRRDGAEEPRKQASPSWQETVIICSPFESTSSLSSSSSSSSIAKRRDEMWKGRRWRRRSLARRYLKLNWHCRVRTTRKIADRGTGERRRRMEWTDRPRKRRLSVSLLEISNACSTERLLRREHPYLIFMFVGCTERNPKVRSTPDSWAKAQTGAERVATLDKWRGCKPMGLVGI